MRRGGGVYNGKDGKFFKSLYIVGRVVLTPLFYENLPTSPTPSPFSNFVPPPSPPPHTHAHTHIHTHTYTHPVTPNPTPSLLSVVLFLWLNRWSRHIWCAIVLNDNIDLHMSSLSTRRTLMCVFCNNVSSLLSSDTYCGFYWYSDLISHTHKHTQHTQGSVDCRTHINIYLHHLLCAHSSYLYYIKY